MNLVRSYRFRKKNLPMCCMARESSGICAISEVGSFPSHSLITPFPSWIWMTVKKRGFLWYFLPVHWLSFNGAQMEAVCIRVVMIFSSSRFCKEEIFMLLWSVESRVRLRITDVSQAHRNRP